MGARPARNAEFSAFGAPNPRSRPRPLRSDSTGTGEGIPRPPRLPPPFARRVPVGKFAILLCAASTAFAILVFLLPQVLPPQF